MHVVDLSVGGGGLLLPALPTVQASMAAAARLQSTPRARKAKQAMYSQVRAADVSKRLLPLLLL